MSTDSCNASSRQIAAPQVLNTQQKIVVNEPASQRRQWQVQTLAAQASQLGGLVLVSARHSGKTYAAADIQPKADATTDHRSMHLPTWQRAAASRCSVASFWQSSPSANAFV